MAKIQVNYVVELGVWVDTDTNEVDKVIQGDIHLDDNEPTIVLNRELGHTDETIYKAIDIADGGEWPSWD